MEFLTAAGKIEDEKSLVSLLHDRAQSLGFAAIAYFRPTIGDLGRIEIRERGFPDGWADEYRRKRHHEQDPQLAYVAQTGRTLQFSRITEKRGISDHQRGFLDQSDDWGLTDGFLVPAFGTMPIPTLGLFPFLGWFAFRQVLHPEIVGQTNIPYLEAIAQATHIQFSRIAMGKESEQPKLAPREVAILNWIASGKTNGEIAMILDIASPTVATYVRRIFQKLDVTDRASAAVKGLKLGIVRD